MHEQGLGAEGFRRTPLPNIPSHSRTASSSLPDQDGSFHWAGVSMATVEETRLRRTLLVGSMSNGCAGGNSQAGDGGVKGQQLIHKPPSHQNKIPLLTRHGANKLSLLLGNL